MDSSVNITMNLDPCPYCKANHKIEKDLEPCPFCCSIALSYLHKGGGFNTICVFCLSCHAEGPISDKKVDAAHKWNRRVVKK